MNSDIRVSVSFRGHRKRKRLRMVLGPGSTDFLLDLWLGTAMNHPDGVLTGMDAMDIALESGWEKDPEKFVNALVDCGFLDLSEDGTYSLHDWEDHQGYVVHAEQRKEKARNAAAKRWGKKQPAKAETSMPSEHTQSNASSMPQACGEHARSNAPLPAPSPAPLAQEEELKAPPIPPAKPGGTPVPRVVESYSDSFEDFWTAYPAEGRKGKQAAYKAWKKAGAGGTAKAPQIIAAIKAQVLAQHFQGNDGKNYVPHATTWLNKGQWADEIVPRRDVQSPGNGTMPRATTVAQAGVLRREQMAREYLSRQEAACQTKQTQTPSPPQSLTR